MGEVLDGVVSKVLNSANKPEEIVLSVSQSDIVLMTSGKREVRLSPCFPFFFLVFVSPLSFSLPAFSSNSSPSSPSLSSSYLLPHSFPPSSFPHSPSLLLPFSLFFSHPFLPLLFTFSPSLSLLSSAFYYLAFAFFPAPGPA